MFMPAEVREDGSYTFKMYEEEWRWIPGYEGLYSISNYGEVYSHSRVIYKSASLNNCSYSVLWNGHFLTPTNQYYGYKNVTLSKNGIQCSKQLHILIALSFLGPRPSGYHVCHNDGDGSNNVLWNLRYDTVAGNMRDKIKHGTEQIGENNSFAKYTEEQVIKIRRLSNEYGTTAISRMLDMPYSSVWNIQYNYWKHV